jgi:hypothetical protein
MKKLIGIILTLTLSLILAGAAGASAERSNKHITPYGDFCKQTSHYGMHKQMLSNQEAGQALEHYFGKKGLDFEILNNRGRFIKAVIKDNGKVVDTIIFDRYSGRIRSIY